MMKFRVFTLKESVSTESIIDALAREKNKIMENINDERADAKKERKTVLTIHYKPNPDTGDVSVTADIGSTLAPLALKEMAHLVDQISFDDLDDIRDLSGCERILESSRA